MNFHGYFLLCLLTNLVYCHKLPAGYKICKRSDTNMNSCLKEAIQDAFSKLPNGIPELKVVPLEPLFVQNVTIGQGKGAVHVVQKYQNMYIHSLSKAKIEKVEVSLEKPIKFHSEISSPEFTLKADYDFDGRLLLLPIRGVGKCTIQLFDCNTTLDFSAETIQKKGKTYLNVVDFTVLLRPSKVHFNFENLFNGDERLGKEINNVLNENSKDVFEDVGSGYEEFLASIGKHVANAIFSRVPFNDIFPM